MVLPTMLRHHNLFKFLHSTLKNGSAKSVRRNVYTYPITFEHVVFPPNEQFKLPTVPAEPVYDENLGETKFKTTRRTVDSKGFEPIHTELMHKQYGLVASNGGFISGTDFAFIQEQVNRHLRDKQFAIWRIDAPWLPRTKIPQGTKLGKKGHIDRYVTPIRAGRIILELGGYITETEARCYLMPLHQHFRFPLEFISQELIEKRRQIETEVQMKNENKFDWETVIKYNMQNCKAWLSPYDVIWKCKHK